MDVRPPFIHRKGMAVGSVDFNPSIPLRHSFHYLQQVTYIALQELFQPFFFNTQIFIRSLKNTYKSLDCIQKKKYICKIKAQRNMKLLFTCLISLLLISCKHNNTNGVSLFRDTISMMQAHHIKLSIDRMSRCIPDNDTTRDDTAKAAFKLIVYVDSTNCSPCVLNKLYEWNRLIGKTRSTGNKVNYIFIFETKFNQIEDAHLAAESSGLKNRIYLDTAYIFRADNNFIPQEAAFHTMLTNAKDSILLVGNPKINKKIEKIFFNIINRRN